jgi:hypothetical protein
MWKNIFKHGPKTGIMGTLKKTFQKVKPIENSELSKVRQLSSKFDQPFQTITFENGHLAQLLNVSFNADPDTVLKTFSLGSPEGLIMVSGDTENLEEPIQQRLTQLLSRGLVKSAMNLNAVLMDNGKTSSLVTLTGQSVADRGHKSPLIGVAATTQVTYPNQTEEEPTSEKATSLDPNHSHFVLVDTKNSHQAIDFKYRLGAAIASHHAAVTILVNGGEDSRAEVLQAVRYGWPIIVLTGTGQLADEIAQLSQNTPDFIPDPVLAEIIADGQISLFPVEDDIEELERLIHRLLHGDNTLKLAWEQFALYDKNATQQQTRFHRLQLSVITIGVLGTLLALLQASLDLQIQQAKPIELAKIILEQSCHDDKTKEKLRLIIHQDQEFQDICQNPHERTKETVQSPYEATFPENYLKKAWKIYQNARPLARFLAKHHLVKLTEHIVAFLQYVIVAIPVIVTILAAVLNRFNSGQKWISLRSTAETLKSEIFRYRTQSGIYQLEPGTEINRETKLADKVQSLNNHLMQTEVNLSALKPYQGTLPPPNSIADNDDGVSVLSPERYLNTRLEDQLNYYVHKTTQLERKWSRLQWGIYTLGGIGTLLAARGLELWMALTTGMATAMASYLAYQQIEERLKKYNRASINLTNIRNWWSALPTSEQAKQTNIDRLVSETENVLGSEFREWMQKMQETVIALKEEQAKSSEKTSKEEPKEDHKNVQKPV